MGNRTGRGTAQGRRWGTWRVSAALGLVVLLAVTGCSGDGDDQGGGTTPGPIGPGGLPPEHATTTEGLEVTGPVTTGRGRPQTATPIDLASRGYVEEEYFLSGDAQSYEPDGEWGEEGRWAVTPAATAPFTTRLLVRRPADPAAFNGTVVVEWLNVSSGVDADIDFVFTAEELLRGGYAWVGVSAQAASFDSDGSASRFGPGAVGLKRWDAERYAPLDHPGDAWSYDIFTKAGAVLGEPGPVDPLAGLRPEVVLATGESQSAFRLLTYTNAVQPVAGVFDGILIHSRDGGGAPLGPGFGADGVPAPARVRADTEVPVFQVQSETDLFALRGDDPTRWFPPARQPDTDRVRTWELAGTAHSDAHYLEVLNAQGNAQFEDFIDLSGVLPRVNDGPQHWVMNAALRALRTWVVDGTAPPTAEPIATAGGTIDRDEHGNALGGVRTPHVDVPVATLSGEGLPLVGETVPFDAATLARLYPTPQSYLEAFERSLTDAVEAGFLLEDDVPAIMAEARAAPPAR